EHRILPSLGFTRTKKMEEVIREIFETVIANKARAELMKQLVYPTVYWKNARQMTSSQFPLPKEVMKVLTPEEIMMSDKQLEAEQVYSLSENRQSPYY
ncbi:MAG: hypothetical protein QXX17_08320, partial [Conexivisphaerales archaeon]